VETSVSCGDPVQEFVRDVTSGRWFQPKAANGMAILDAILAGERDPVELASLCNRRIRSSRQIVAKSLEGDYRSEHLFALRQSLAGYRFYKQLMAEVDLELEQKMRNLPRAKHAPDKRPAGTKKRIYQHAGNEPAFDLKEEVFRIAGVDLTDVPGISTLTAHTILNGGWNGCFALPQRLSLRILAGTLPGKESERWKGPLHTHSQGEEQSSHRTAPRGTLPLYSRA
jgi:hypothetical protein